LKPLQYCVSVILNSMKEHPEDIKVFLKLGTIDFVNAPPVKAPKEKSLGELRQILKRGQELHKLNSPDTPAVKEAGSSKYRKASYGHNRAVTNALKDWRIDLFEGNGIKSLLRDPSIFMSLSSAQKKRLYEKVSAKLQENSV